MTNCSHFIILLLSMLMQCSQNVSYFRWQLYAKIKYFLMGLHPTQEMFASIKNN